MQKMAKLDEVLAAHCRADLVTECMKKKKNTNIIRRLSFSFLSAENECPFSFSFSAVNEISFSSAFSFTAENEKCFSVCLKYASQKCFGLCLEHQAWSWS